MSRDPRRSSWDGIPDGLLAVAVVILVALAFSAWNTPDASAASGWQRGLASSYGPGLWGNRTACGLTLRRSTRGVAHRSLPCGTRLRICQRGQCVHARVVDRGPYSGSRVLDLTSATTHELCSCSPRQWGVRMVAWKRAPL